MEKTILGVFAALVLTFNTAQAAFVTTNEAGMDAIFSQPSFGDNPVDIRFGPVRELVAPGLLDLTTNEEVFALFSQHIGGPNTANAFFVDAIRSCGAVGLQGVLNPLETRLVGCGETPGNDFAVESEFAGTGFGPELLAHELGHNLTLPHVSLPNNLMNAVLDGGTDLLESQVSAILGSPLVQSDNGSLFITITPVLVVGAATPDPTPVPAPGTALLFSLGLAIMQFKRRKG